MAAPSRTFPIGEHEIHRVGFGERRIMARDAGWAHEDVLDACAAAGIRLSEARFRAL